jgi:hypothetical protein
LKTYKVQCLDHILATLKKESGTEPSLLTDKKFRKEIKTIIIYLYPKLFSKEL